MKKLLLGFPILLFLGFLVFNRVEAAVLQADFSVLNGQSQSNPTQSLGAGLTGTFNSVEIKFQKTGFCFYQAWIREYISETEWLADVNSATRQYIPNGSKTCGGNPGFEQTDVWVASDYPTDIVFDPNKFYILFFYQLDGQLRGSASNVYPNGKFCSYGVYNGQPALCELTVKDIYFVLNVGGPPPQVSNLTQLKPDRTTSITEGGTTTDSTLVFQSELLAGSENFPIKLEVEVRKAGENFLGRATASSVFVFPGNTVSISTTLPNGFYHWQARAVDTYGVASEWQEFGVAGNMDFEVRAVPLHLISQTDSSALNNQYQSNPTQSLGTNLSGTFNSLEIKFQKTGFCFYQVWIREYNNEASWLVSAGSVTAQYIPTNSKSCGGNPGFEQTDVWTANNYPSPIVFDPAKFYVVFFYQLDAALRGSSSNNFLNGKFCSRGNYNGEPDTCEGTLKDIYFVLNVESGRDPVLIVPGILGSEEKDGVLILQPRLKSYDSLKLTFLANGYAENETLFDFPYNWRKSNVLTASLLKDKIQVIKNICQCGKVDIIAHSMGGLVAREYIQSNSYQNDVDQLIFLGTPHIGAPKAYLSWEGGTSGVELSIQDLLLDAILRQEAIEAGFGSFTDLNQILFNYIHSTSSPILSVQELLPIYDYLKDMDTDTLRTYPIGYPQNAFLENLNSPSSLVAIEQGGARITNIFSDDQLNTISLLKVRNDSSTLPLWEHGVPKEVGKGGGDGTVPTNSSLALDIANKTDFNIGGKHGDMPTNAIAKIFEILASQPPATVVTISPVERFLSIFGLSPVDILITAPDGRRVGKDFVTGQEINEIDGAFYTGFNTPNENIFIPGPLDGEYIITTQGTGSGSYEILAEYGREEAGLATSTSVSFTANTATGLVENLNFSLSSSTPGFSTIVPEDTTPPAIIHTLIPSEVIFNSSSTIFHFSAQDDLTGVFSLATTLDGQPIGDGAIINFAVPGQHTINIEAADFVGNVSTKTIDFDVVYNFGGFLPPIRTDGGGIYKRGRTVPVKFQLTDINNQFISTAVARLFVAKIQDGIVGTEEAPLSTSSAGTDNFFRYDQTENKYIYNLSTKTMSVGTWQLKVALDDGRNYTVIISIR